MEYQASSKGYYYSMQQQGTQFERDYSSADYQEGPELQPYYQNEAERGSNLDKLLM